MNSNLVFFILFLFGVSHGARSQTLDQSQLNYNSGISARTLPGYSIFQSFTAGITGTLVQIDMGVFNAISGSGTLKIYAGTDTTGTLLQNTTVSINCPSGSCFANFTTSVQITAGQSYTFHFTPGNGIPDPYGVQAEVPGTYPGGQFGLIDPSGVYYPGFDLVFRTFVVASVGIVEAESTVPGVTLCPNPLVTYTTLISDSPLTGASLTMVNSLGQMVRKWVQPEGNDITIHREGLPGGIYFLRVETPGHPNALLRLVICD